MKDFKHTHKMHHGAHPMFGGSSARPSAPAMPPMMPPGGMGGIQSAGEDMASSAPGGMSGGAPSGMGAGGAGAAGGAAGGTGGAGYRHGGKVMKKARGGMARDGQDDDSGTLRTETMPSGAQQYVRGNTRKEKGQTLSDYQQNEIDQMKPGSSDIGSHFDKFDKLSDASVDNLDKWDKEIGLKKGGMAKGGKNWIKGAIKHPGALHRQLGVPAGEKIPAKKLEKAMHSSNPTLAKRARLAKTLKGFKK
jgi:hypothetical protein